MATCIRWECTGATVGSTEYCRGEHPMKRDSNRPQRGHWAESEGCRHWSGWKEAEIQPSGCNDIFGGEHSVGAVVIQSLADSKHSVFEQ